MCETKIVGMIIMQHQTDVLQIEIFKHFTGVEVRHKNLDASCVHTTQWHRQVTSPAHRQV